MLLFPLVAFLACQPGRSDSDSGGSPADSDAQDSGDSSAPPDSVDSADTGPVDDGDPPTDPEIPVASCTQSGLGTDADTLVNRYDEDGQHVSTTFVNSASSGSNYTETWTWTDGHVTLDTYDDDGDGTLDTIDAYTYDGDDLQVWSHDDDGDGTIASADDAVYTLLYDSGDGALQEMDRDDRGDGTPDALYLYTYDDYGLLTGLTVDEGLDGTVDTRVVQTTSTNDEGETIVQTTTDEGDDGAPELVDLVITDSQGRTTYMEEDADGNGDLDWTWTWTWGDAGELVSVTMVAWSMSGEEDYDVTTSYTYDEWGRDARWTIDSSYAAQYVWVWTWSCLG